MATDTLKDFHSPATKYEALLMEQRTKPLSKDGAVLTFEVFDQLIPHLGVFRSVMQNCRDQLFDAVFSNKFTGSAQGGDKYVGRLTYFELVQQGKCSDEEKLEEMNKQLERVKQMLFDKQKLFEDAEETIQEQKEKIFDLKLTVTQLDDQLSEQKVDLCSLKKTLAEEQERNVDTERNLQCNLANFKEDLQEAQSEVYYLSQYKSGYDDLYQAFVSKTSLDEDSEVDKVIDPMGTIATKRSYLMSSVINANKLEEQLLTVQNATVEEFDKFLENHKSELTTHQDEDEDDEDVMIHLDRADQQLMLIQERFRHTTAKMNRELALLRQHRTMLLEQLQILEESTPEYIKKKKKYNESSRPETGESAALSAGLVDEDDEEDEEAARSDPFVPQERIFCKYAAMIYTSNNDGKTFHEIAEAEYCASCGEKTVICPHKIIGRDEMLRLPEGTTSIKISRPKVRLNHDLLGAMLKSWRAGNADDQTMHESKSFSPAGSLDFLSGYASVNIQQSIASEDRRLSMADSNHLGYPIGRLIDDYNQRTKLERKVSRLLSVDRVVSIIEQFASYLLWLDDFAAEEQSQEDRSFLDILYEFMTERYLKEDIAFFATHDLFTALGEYCNTNKLIWLMSQVLIGNLDGAAFRYILLIGDFVDRVAWKNAEDFRAFAEVLYPFLNEEDLETLQIGYTSFSENKISKTLVVEYIIYCVMKHREPLFVETEMKLQSHQRVTVMTEQEFSEACDAVLSVSNEKLRHVLYRQANAYVCATEGQNERVPLKRLSQITSYLNLLHLSNVIKAAVSDRVTTARMRSNSITDGKSASSHTSQIVKSEYRLMTLTDVKALAASVAKRDLCRQLRQQGVVDDDF